MSDLPPPPWPPAAGGASSWTPPPRRRSGSGLAVALAITVVVALLAGTLAVVQSVRLARAEQEVADLEAEAAELERRVARLEAGAGSGLDDLLGGLLGEDAGALEDLLGGLLGDGGLGGLFGDGGLDSLFGDSGLDGLFGGGSALDLVGCIGMPSGGGSGALPDDTRAAIDAIAAQVEAERELAFTGPVAAEILAPGALAERVRSLTLEDYSEADADVDARLLAALGAIPPGTDLRALVIDLLGDQVAGFYDPDTGEMVALGGADLDAMTKVTLAHELTHALTDQALGLPDLAGFDGQTDAALAAQAVIEGDATLLMQRWAMSYLSLMEQFGMAGDSIGAQADLAGVPYHLQQQLVFPYLAGMNFVCDHFTDAGWVGVDALYSALPRTTAEILWPERYRNSETPRETTLPRAPGAGWETLRTDTLGAAELMWLFEAPGGETRAALPDPGGAAAAWAGGRVAVFGRGDDSAVAVALADRDGGDRLCAAVAAWYRAAFPAATEVPVEPGDRLAMDGPSQDAVLHCDAGNVRLGIAPDVATARLLTR
jgi:hypothetical protein